MKSVLVTGFEPFAGKSVNAAWEAVQTLGRDGADGRAVIAIRQLPTAFGEASVALRDAIEAVQPDIVLCFGEAGGRSAVSVERIAVNLNDARIADNLGAQPREQAIVAGGPAAFFSKLPVRSLVDHLRAAGIPAEESWSAGTFVCNHVFYALMHLIAEPSRSERGVIGGFIHVPYLPEQAARNNNAPSLGRMECIRAVEMVVEFVVTNGF